MLISQEALTRLLEKIPAEIVKKVLIDCYKENKQMPIDIFYIRLIDEAIRT